MGQGLRARRGCRTLADATLLVSNSGSGNEPSRRQSCVDFRCGARHRRGDSTADGQGWREGRHRRCARRAGRETARAVESAGAEAIYTRLDVTREEDWSAAIAAVTDRFGGLDILVNNAGVFLGMSIEEATLADWHRLCAVNFTGVFLGTKFSCRRCGRAGGKSRTAVRSSICPRSPGSSARQATRSIR